MPSYPEEDTLLTLYADVLYYFSAPNSRPFHHRFDKGSYVYLHHDPSRRRGRLEVANNVGSPDQDAFSGFLDFVHVEYSHKHTNLVTLVVQESSSSQPENQQWHLPAMDERNEGKYLYKIHTLDVYFWSREDALDFVESLKTILPQGQLKVADAPVPTSTSEEVLSPVVQKLEQAAISDPTSGQLGRGSTSTTSTFPPPPPPPAANGSNRASVAYTGAQESPGFAPLPYNPAAPAAPEPIKPREKTPPPPDAGTGTGLASAAVSDQGLPFGAPSLQHQHSFPAQGPSPPYQQQQQHQYFSPTMPQPQSYFAGPPSTPSSLNTPASNVSPLSQPQRTNSFGPPPPSVPGTVPTQPFSPMSATFSIPGAFSPPPNNPTAHLYGSAAPPPQSPTSQGYPPSYGQPPQTPYYVPESAQPYSNYSYTEPAQQAQANQDIYAVHQQVYRPTEAEAKHGHGPKNPTAGPGQQSATGRLEKRAEKMEKGVNRFLKKLEQKIG